MYLRTYLSSIAFLALLHAGPTLAQTDCIRSYQNPQDRFPHNTAQPASRPFVLKTAEIPLTGVKYRARGESTEFTLDDYLKKFCTTGLLVLKDDAIVIERYLQHHAASDHLLSASMSKTVLALLVGIAIDEKKIAPDEKVKAVLPDFKDSAFADASIEDLLRMSSGAALIEGYQIGAFSDNLAVNPMVEPYRDTREYLREKTAQAAKPGSVFAYNGVQTAVLGLALTERLGGNLTAYLEEKLWKPMGAESKAHWLKNRHGQEGTQGFFVATLRDYARLGYLVMNRGRIGGRQVVPAAWIDQMVELRRDKPQPAAPPYYGLHIWIPQAAGGRSLFWGTNGQNIFVDPVARVVIVHTGNSPKAEFHGNGHLFPLRDAISKYLTIPATASPATGPTISQ
jgi:CubicO group peptidase (beta-lactamase class C family)